MKIYLDTEFTSLENPKLISIGIVAADGQEFYRELTTGWALPDCTMFVLGWVLPWLSNGRAGNRLYSKLGSHFDLIQHETDIDNRFSKVKEHMLMEAFQADTGLRDHLHFLASSYDTVDLLVVRNKHIAGLIGDYPLERLLTGDQAQSKAQVKADLVSWLQQFADPEICCDSNYDIDLLKDLIDQPFKWRLVENQSELKLGLLHHALNDVRMLMIFNRSVEVLGSKESALNWLKSQIAGLGGRKPIDLLDRPAGFEMLLNELGRLEHGGYFMKNCF